MESEKPGLQETSTFVLTILVTGGPVPAAVRLRRLLKAMLRGYGAHCLAIRPADANDEGER